ncbi:MAG: anthranilate phosphoribosyltransferase [Mariprofundaceae bacterium]|nr:anthranilate phosphoribosyltransferase [Mariprofundaceae bacterium]
MIASAIAQVARGRNGAQDLSIEQAKNVFYALLDDAVDPLQLGAFLIAERMKGETAEELAGFVLAARDRINAYPSQAGHSDWIDLPCYAGKCRAAPAHLVAALRWRDQGHAVIVHGVDQIAGRCTAWSLLQKAGVSQATTLAEAEHLMATEKIAYIDLSVLCPPLMRLYGLRTQLGVRSFVNTVARLLNPLRCGGQLNGVFHTPYVKRMIAVNRHLKQPRSMVFMGAEGEPELYSNRQKLTMLQTYDAVTTIKFQDTGHDLYPKTIHDKNTITAQFLRMCGNEASEPERARIERSMQALRWAKSGEAFWTKSEELLLQPF